MGGGPPSCAADRRLRRSYRLLTGAGASETRSVLVADDDGATRFLIRAALEQDGWVIEEAVDGSQACASLDRVRPDLVLLDVDMPGVDGFKTCAHLRSLDGGQLVPVLMITGVDDQESVNRAYEAGATDFLSKPFNITILRQRVQYMYRSLAARGENQQRTRLDRSPESIIICTLVRMSMGTRRKRRRQEALWVATTDLPQTVAHQFYRRVNALLDAHGFDAFVERQCQRFYAATRGRPSLTPGIYFRALLVGYFEGIDSERGIAWRAADSLAIRRFLGIAVDEDVPDHSTISRTRRLIDVETHRAVFTWVQQRLVASGVLKGATIGIDATTLEANAAMRSIVRRDTGEDYQAYLTGLAQASGIATPTRDDLARLDRKRKKTTSNKDWRSPVDPDAKVAKMKDGRTHLAHKVEHAVDLDTGAVVAVTVQGADTGDTTTIGDTTVAAADQIEDAQAEVDDPQAFTALVADKGYHSNEVMVDLQAVGVRSYVAEPDRGRRDWSKAREAQAPVYANRRRIRGARGKRLMRRRGERIERSFAHAYETGGMRRTHLRGHRNILKRLLIHLAGFNLGVLFRQLIGVGTPRSLQGRCLAALMVLVSSWRRLVHVWTVREPEYPARSTIGVGDHDRSLIPKAA